MGRFTAIFKNLVVFRRSFESQGSPTPPAEEQLRASGIRSVGWSTLAREEGFRGGRGSEPVVPRQNRSGRNQAAR